jgi:hypothetical protein
MNHCSHKNGIPRDSVKKGNALVREGETRRLRYRFVNPLMRPYVIMRGVTEGLLTEEMRQAISATS